MNSFIYLPFTHYSFNQCTSLLQFSSLIHCSCRFSVQQQLLFNPFCCHSFILKGKFDHFDVLFHTPIHIPWNKILLKEIDGHQPAWLIHHEYTVKCVTMPIVAVNFLDFTFANWALCIKHGCLACSKYESCFNISFHSRILDHKGRVTFYSNTFCL